MTNTAAIPVSLAASLRASDAFALVQGSLGWWYEQFNPAPVQVYNNRPDIIAGPRYWLMNVSLHANPQQWRGHRPEVAIGPAQMRSGAEYWAVRTWRVPADGTVQITGTARAVASDRIGAQVRIVYNAPATGSLAQDQPVWAGRLQAAPVQHDLTLTVHAGAAIRFILAADTGHPTGSVDWDPRIAYHVTR